MISKSATAESMAVEANRNMLKEMDKILDAWKKRLSVTPKAASRSAAKPSAKKK